MPILLTSTGLTFDGPKRAFLELVKKNNKIGRALIITTAATGKSRHKYSRLAYNQLQEIGFKEVAFLDLEQERTVDLSLFTLVYVCGGNTFRLMRAINNSNFKLQLTKFLRAKGLYVGVSAGSIVVGPNISVAAFGDGADENLVNLKDLSGLGLLNYSVAPHYLVSEAKELQYFAKAAGYKIKGLSDQAWILIS